MYKDILEIIEKSGKSDFEESTKELEDCINTDENFIETLRACLQTSYRSQISEAARHTKAAKTSASLS